MATAVDAVGEPIPTSAVLISASKHIAGKCRGQNIAFLKCKKDDPNPEKCLDKGNQVTRCVLSLMVETYRQVEHNEVLQQELK
ncbi:putative NADH dehydrogenase [ubiquinone] (complex I), alpha subcomplex, subunit 8 [Helianthus annuus]|nr:putative NADH dehydrogenase [ubiquinone] (complex I), alpha subcomplex, subunit 8 [Helianthus annuus]